MRRLSIPHQKRVEPGKKLVQHGLVEHPGAQDGHPAGGQAGSQPDHNRRHPAVDGPDAKAQHKPQQPVQPATRNVGGSQLPNFGNEPFELPGFLKRGNF